MGYIYAGGGRWGEHADEEAMRTETIPHILPLIAFQLGFLSSLTWPGDARATLCRLHTRGDQEKRATMDRSAIGHPTISITSSINARGQPHVFWRSEGQQCCADVIPPDQNQRPMSTITTQERGGEGQ